MMGLSIATIEVPHTPMQHERADNDTPCSSWPRKSDVRMESTVESAAGNTDAVCSAAAWGDTVSLESVPIRGSVGLRYPIATVNRMLLVSAQYTLCTLTRRYRASD
jgi:hypothetical protein